MKFSIIIVNYNSTKYIKRLVKSIYNYLKNYEYEIIVVDNNSPNRDIEDFAKKESSIRVLFLDKNFGFGYANNRGIETAKYDYYFLLNPDTFFADDSIGIMLETIKNNPSWGIVGPMVKYTDGGIQESAFHFPNIRYEIYSFLGILSQIIRVSKQLRRKLFKDKEYEPDFIFGSCMLINKKLNDIINGFDEDYFLFTEETDYCYRAKKLSKYKTIYFPKSVIYHEAGAVTKKEPIRRFFWGYNSKLIFINKHYKGIYSFLIRYAIILIFLKKWFYSYLSGNLNYLELRGYLVKIIKNYINNTPEFNEAR